MKTQRYKIFGCLSLIGVIAILTWAVASIANGQATLTDTEMVNVYGGGCQYCGWDGQDCSPDEGGTGDCRNPVTCTGTYWTSCLQEKDDCIDGYVMDCTPTTSACSGTYTYGVCEKVGETGCKFTEWKLDCDGSKPDCTDS